MFNEGSLGSKRIVRLLKSKKGLSKGLTKHFAKQSKEYLSKEGKYSKQVKKGYRKNFITHRSERKDLAKKMAKRA